MTVYKILVLMVFKSRHLVYFIISLCFNFFLEYEENLMAKRNFINPSNKNNTNKNISCLKCQVGAYKILFDIIFRTVKKIVWGPEGSKGSMQNQDREKAIFSYTSMAPESPGKVFQTTGHSQAPSREILIILVWDGTWALIF